jgi:fructose-specific component phosphotransferase system IIB-like protein
MQRKLIAFTAAAALLGNTLVAGAQEQGHRIVVAPQEEEIFIAQGPGIAPPPPVGIRGDNVMFMATEMSFAGPLVKGAPYSAQAVTESVQQLTDGNRIVRKNTAQVYRDTEGRTRRDQSLGYIGPYSADVPQTVFINDPVASVLYILDPAKKTARKLPRVELRFRAEGDAAQARQRAAEGGVQKFEIERNFVLQRTPGPDAPPPPQSPNVTGTTTIIAPPAPPAGDGERVEFFASHSRHEGKTEKLEPRSFDGVTAEGTRTTMTIPAGEIGNEQPIQIVDERWYSPELQVVVMTRHSDPRSGETTYRLTNISRAEPASALFQVPSDYAVQDTTPPAGVRRIRRPAAPPPPQEN